MLPIIQLLLMSQVQEQYLLRDDFTDTRAAGSVNGTLAVPGPGGARIVTDTETKISQSGGNTVFAGGKAAPAWGDPGRWWAGIVRAAGRLLITKVNTSTIGANGMMIGFDINQAGGLGDVHTLWITPGGVLSSYNSAALTVIGAIATNNPYTMAILLRSTGCFYIIKGGTFTNFTLLYIAPTASHATIYPALSNNDNVAMVDFIRVPVTLWLPTPLASDGMTSATLTDGAGHAETTGVGSGGGNVPWATAATWAVAGGVALNTPVLGGELAAGNLVVGTWYSITATQADHFYVGCAVGDHFRATAATALDANNKVKAFTTAELFRLLAQAFTADVLAQITNVARTDRTSRGLAVRLNDPTTPTSGIIARFDGLGNISVVEFSGATYTQLFTAAKAWAASDSLQLIADGANIRLIHLTSACVATLIGSTAAATITTGNYHGLFSTDPGNTLDNLVIYSRGTDNSYSILDRWSK
jgi:hypothetical protein